MEPDCEIVERVKQGQAHAYELLVVRYQHAAMAVALRVLKDRQQAEDAVQESFVLAYQNLKALRDGSRFGPWLMRITKRQAIRAARRRRLFVSVQTTAEPLAAPMSAVPAGHDRLVELIGRLPAHERLVLALHYLDGHSTAEIAAITGRPMGTITKQLSRAVQRLRRWAG